MYTKYFQLSEEPFSIAANPRFLYLSEQHREALAHLHYGIRMDSGFVMLTGEVGTGKTTVCRCLIEQLPEDANVAYILNPRVSVEELLSSICDEFHIKYAKTRATVKTYVDAINRYLLDQYAKGRNSVVIVDEAQNLTFEVLEQLRLLTNLETHERKLLRIMLIGQPELEEMLARPELRQLEQRITARYDLKPLERSELQPYIMHRLALAGCRETVFPPRLADQIYARSRGIPRLINVICDRAMLGAYSKSQRQVDRRIIDDAAREVQGPRKAPERRSGFGTPVAALVLVLLGVGVYFLYDRGLIELPLESFVEASLDSPGPSEAKSSEVAPPEAGNSEAQPMAAEVSEAESVEAQAPEREVSEPEPPLPSTQVAMLGSVSAVTEAAASPPRWPETVSAANNGVTSAQNALFRAWGLPAPKSGIDACDQAVEAGLSCYSGSGNLGMVASNDRPAILVLLDDSGKPYPALLRSLSGDTASIEFAHGVETVTRDDLERRWRGRFQMLWRMAPQGRFVIKPGDRGSPVTWLTESLRTAGIDSVEVTDRYDERVMAAVQAFQSSRGLIGDGIAGRQTLIHLNTVADRSVPRLESEGAG